VFFIDDGQIQVAGIDHAVSSQAGSGNGHRHNSAVAPDIKSFDAVSLGAALVISGRVLANGDVVHVPMVIVEIDSRAAMGGPPVHEVEAPERRRKGVARFFGPTSIKAAAFVVFVFEPQSRDRRNKPDNAPARRPTTFDRVHCFHRWHFSTRCHPDNRAR
jgi:hypothetical protein